MSKPCLCPIRHAESQGNAGEIVRALELPSVTGIIVVPKLQAMLIERLPVDKSKGSLQSALGGVLSKDVLLAYMRGCPVVTSARTLVPDRIDPNGKRIPLTWYSDAMFAWTAELIAYIDRYDIGVPAHFVARVVQQRGVPVSLSDDERRAVSEAMREPAAPPAPTLDSDVSSEIFLPALVGGGDASKTAASIVADGVGTRSAHPLPDRIRLLEVAHPTGLQVHAILDTEAPIGPAAVWAMYVPPVSLEVLCHIPSPMVRDENDPLSAVLRGEPLEASAGVLVAGVVADLDLLLQRLYTSSLMTLRFGFVLNDYRVGADGFPGGSLLDDGVLVVTDPGCAGWWASHIDDRPGPSQLVDAVVTAQSDPSLHGDLVWVDLDTALGAVRTYVNGHIERVPDVGTQISAWLTGILVGATDHYDELAGADPALVDRLTRSRWRGPLPGR
jgi:hypothetical protein